MLGSVRGVVSNDHSYRDKDQISQGPRVFIRPKATCAAPLCEVLTPCRGQRPHHVQKDRIGTWDISCLAALVECLLRRRSASGRRGAVADDERSREVGPRHSSREAGEQSGAIRSGVGGAKGRDQGECRPTKHAPDSEPGKRVTGVGSHTAHYCRRYPRWEKLW